MSWADPRDEREVDLAVGRALAYYRLRAGLSQAEAARRLGEPQSFIAKMETGRRRLLYREAVQIATLYSMSNHEFSKLAEGEGPDFSPAELEREIAWLEEELRRRGGDAS